MPKTVMFLDESYVMIGSAGYVQRRPGPVKNNLVDYGFSCPVLDNRPLKFEEFETKMRHDLCDPAAHENEQCQVVEQVPHRSEARTKTHKDTDNFLVTVYP
jgi:excinuclease UvrABC helicase subunit UvrB